MNDPLPPRARRARPRLGPILACAIVSATAAPTASAREGVQERDDDAFYYDVAIRVDPSALQQPDAPETSDSELAVIRDELGDEVERFLREHHVVLAPGDADPSGVAVLTIALRWVNPEDLVWEVEVRGEAPDREAQSFRFEQTYGTLDAADRIAQELPTILRWVERPGSEPTQPPDRPPIKDSPPKPRRLGPLGGVGIGLLVAGAGSLITGAVLYPRTQTTLETDPSGGRVEVTQRRYPAAMVAVGIGAAGIAAGIAMIVADRVRAKRKRGSSRTAATPVVTGRLLGLSLQRRF